MSQNNLPKRNKSLPTTTRYQSTTADRVDRYARAAQNSAVILVAIAELMRLFNQHNQK